MSFQSILVSVIMPVFNAEKYIVQAIESILQQGFDQFELIIVDDASNDNSVLICREYEAKYPDKVRVFELPVNMRQGAARNRGIDEARGKYVVFVDSDDWIHSDMLSLMVQSIEESEADIAATN